MGVRSVYKEKTTVVEWLRMVTKAKIFAIWRNHEWAMNDRQTDYVECNIWDIRSYLRTVETKWKKYFGLPFSCRMKARMCNKKYLKCNGHLSVFSLYKNLQIL